ncbi:hypothetical protein LDI01_09090 [Lentilactobacillus diolivorans]|uniref:Integral membrane protein n=2 Tax=Lentilactobacillus diolivorans TaxID=179838 RepID=A0ABQ0XB37_9LACO|nr:hypothetical protein LDI01_09090 [Lentilactobacillus diolivorans]
MIILTILIICFVLVIECALLMRGKRKDEMSRYFLSHALVEVGFVTIIVSLFSVVFDIVGLLMRPKGVTIENAQVASLLVNIKYLVISIGTYLIFYIRYQYMVRHSDKEGD